jgi:hypothetical protein
MAAARAKVVIVNKISNPKRMYIDLGFTEDCDLYPSATPFILFRDRRYPTVPQYKNQ